MTDRRAGVALAASLVRSPISGLRSLALRRGLLGGSRPWMIVAGVLWGLRLLRRASGRRPELLAVERLKPGQTLQITALSDRASGGAQ